MAWTLGPFTPVPQPILEAAPALPWASKHVFNPGAIVRDEKVHLLVRGEDTAGRFAGTSRIGVATSEDGVDFTLEPDAVLGPDDAWTDIEREGGCEDPRVVAVAPHGPFVCTYTGFDGRSPTLMVATSPDLRTWTKHGPAFATSAYAAHTAKSGAIVTELRDGGLVAATVNGKYWMYWGEGTCFAATSDDLIRWTPLDYDATGDRHLSFDDGRWRVHRTRGDRALRPLLSPRLGRFDSGLVEPGPPAIRTDDGIVLLYNGANHPNRGDASLPALAYTPGQALFDSLDPSACVARTTEPFLRPTSEAEQRGQVANVCFAQGLVAFKGEWRLYYGMADARIGCAVAPMDL